MIKAMVTAHEGGEEDAGRRDGVVPGEGYGGFRRLSGL